MRWLTSLYDFRFKWTATAQIGIHPTISCLSQLVNFKMQSRRLDDLEERYAIKFCFKLEKISQKRMGCVRLLFGHLAWIEHQLLSGIKDSRQAGSLWGMMRVVGGVRKSMQQRWLAKRLELGLLCWGFKVVQERFLGKRPALFKSGQWHFNQDNAPLSNSILVTDYLTKMRIKTVSPYSPDLAPGDFWLFPKLRGCRYEKIDEMKETVTKVIDSPTQEDFHGAFQMFLERYNKCIAAGDYLEGD